MFMSVRVAVCCMVGAGTSAFQVNIGTHKKQWEDNIADATWQPDCKKQKPIGYDEAVIRVSYRVNKSIEQIKRDLRKIDSPQLERIKQR
jgi:hypothetical protein